MIGFAFHSSWLSCSEEVSWRLLLILAAVVFLVIEGVRTYEK